MSKENILLIEYLPNGRIGEYYCYSNSKIRIVNISTKDKEFFTGYLIRYRSNPFKKEYIVIYGKGDSLYIDLGDGPEELLTKPCKVSGVGMKHTVSFTTAKTDRRIKTHTPILRHLGNDGMFPEDIEPVLHLIQKMTSQTERVRFINKFCHGDWGD